MNIAKYIVGALNSKPKTEAYDTQAEIVRIDDDGTAWVHIPGGVDETPVKMTISAEEGQTVQVRVANGTAFLIGNMTAPPTDNTVADSAYESAEESVEKSSLALFAVEDAWNKAENAENVAGEAVELINSGRIWYAECNTAAATVAKVATISPATTDFALYPGATVNVKFSVTNSGAVASLTLNVNDTGAKSIKYTNNGSYGNIPSSGYLKINQIYQFIYDGTYWIVSALNYNSTYSLGNNQYYNTLLAKSAIPAECIIVGDSSGYAMAASGVTFDITYPILWCNAAIAVNKTNYANIYTSIYDRNLATNYADFSGTAKSMVYLVCTLSGKTATIDTAVITCTVPTSEDGKIYIPIGRLGNESTGKNYLYFICDTTPVMYMFVNGSFQPINANTVIEEQYIYIQAVSGTASKAGVTTWITATGESVTADASGLTSVWTTKRPTYRSKYPVIFIAKQTKKADGTVTCTTPLKDDTLTVIDGGHIITGSVDASKITAESITIGKLAPDAISAINDAKKMASNYLASDETGIMIADLADGQQTPKTATGRNVFIDSNAVHIRDAKTDLAKFGSNVLIGKNDESHLVMDYHSIQAIDKDSNTYFHVSDLRDVSGEATFEFTFTGDGSTTVFEISPPASQTISVKIDNAETTDYSVVSYSTKSKYTFTVAPSDGAEIYIKIISTSPSYAYTLGIRSSLASNIGAYSVAEGYQSVASGGYSHAEGWMSEASGLRSHVEGEHSTASGSSSHAEGYQSVASGGYSHAEGSSTASGHRSHAEGLDTTASGQNSHAEGIETTASGQNSHAEGIKTTASGFSAHAEGNKTIASDAYSHAEGYQSVASKDFSHAQNLGTIASQKAQTSIGRYNIEDTSTTLAYGEYALIIGNGYSDTERSNALTVDWNGNIETAGNVETAGKITLPKNRYKSAGGGIDCRNSDIVNFGAIYGADVSGTAGEGILFYRDGTNWDGIFANDGVLYFAPNYTRGDGNTKDKIVMHEGNLDDYLCFAKGTYNFGTVGNGYTTGTSGSVYIFLDLQKPIPSGATLTLNSLTGVYLRGVNGSILSNASVSSNVTIALQAGSGKLRLYFTGQTTNWKANTPVSFVGTINFTIS